MKPEDYVLQESVKLQGMLNTIFRKSDMLRKHLDVNPKYIYAGHNEMHAFKNANRNWAPIHTGIDGELYVYQTQVVRVNKEDHLEVGGYD